MEKLPTPLRKVISILYLKWHGIGLSVVSILYGVRLYLNIDTLNHEALYDRISSLFDLRLVSAFFVTAGFIKLLGIILNRNRLRIAGVTSLAVLWSVMGVTYLPTPNTIAILAIGCAWTAYGVLIREDFK